MSTDKKAIFFGELLMRLGTFYLETGASQRPSKVIYDRAASPNYRIAAGRY